MNLSHQNHLETVVLVTQTILTPCIIINCLVTWIVKFGSHIRHIHRKIWRSQTKSSWHDIIHNHLTTANDLIIRTCLCHYFRVTIVLRVKHISTEYAMNSPLKIVNNFWINHNSICSITCFIHDDSILILECNNFQQMIT